jgi:RNAse (barnase) inhibitor barstar
MKEIILDAKTWERPDDLYDAFFKAVGSPSWHGRNFDALNDSIAAGQINTVEVPYRLVIRNYDQIGPNAMGIAADFVSLVEEIGSRGCPVEIRIER